MKAYITYLSTNNYLAGVLVLKHSLDVVKAKYPLYCIITKEVNAKSIESMEKMGIKTILVDNIGITDEMRNSVKNENFTHWNKAWDKLNIFCLEQFEKIVYLDCDMIVYQNIDELFEKENMTASTDGIWVYGEERAKDLNAGLMVIEPNKKTFGDIIKFINGLSAGGYTDQIILQKFVDKWGESKELHLSECYNVWVPYADKYPKEIIDNVKVLHYIGKIKPFMSKQYCESGKKFYDLYFDYLEKIKSYLPLKLSILVPQYKEDFGIVKNLLDSIQMQQDVDFNDIEVIIANDGTNVLLDEKEFEKYSYKIIYKKRKQNKGVSYTRNELMKYANGEYIMFCDADDMFFNIMGLFLILREANRGFDVFSSTFVEESRVNGEPAFIIRPDNRTFVHGKVLRKQYLIDNEITWNDEMKIHEDFYFFAQAFCLTNEIRYCPEYFYLWKWRKDSVARTDKEFRYKTYDICIYNNIELIKELLRKKAVEQAQYYVTKIIYEIYSMVNGKDWIESPYREQTIKAIAKYYKEFKGLFKKSKDKEIFIQQQKIDTKKFAKFLKELEKSI